MASRLLHDGSAVVDRSELRQMRYHTSCWSGKVVVRQPLKLGRIQISTLRFARARACDRSQSHHVEPSMRGGSNPSTTNDNLDVRRAMRTSLRTGETPWIRRPAAAEECSDSDPACLRQRDRLAGAAYDKLTRSFYSRAARNSRLTISLFSM